jgi:predicted nucleic acid-binding protein
MKVLLDTNILLRLSNPGDSQHALTKSALAMLESSGDEAVIVPQVLYEYWVVATRPLENNGFGLSPEIADQAVTKWTSLFRLLLDERGVFTHWRDLVKTNQVKGKTAHDARLVAAMIRHNVTRLLTFNWQDFARFTQIEVISPSIPTSNP